METAVAEINTELRLAREFPFAFLERTEQKDSTPPPNLESFMFVSSGVRDKKNSQGREIVLTLHAFLCF